MKNKIFFLSLVLIVVSYSTASEKPGKRKSEERDEPIAEGIKLRSGRVVQKVTRSRMDSLIASWRRKLPEGMASEDVDWWEQGQRRFKERQLTDPDGIKSQFQEFSACFDPSMPARRAVKYCNKLRKTIEGNPLEFIQEGVKQDNPKAFIIQRYFKTIISKAISLRKPELKADQYGDELEQSIAAVHANLGDLTYIATGKNSPLLTQEQWDEQWKEVERALDDDLRLNWSAVAL